MQFLSHCTSLAQQLPAGVHVINLCNNRYRFLVAFCAVILRNQTNLLPPNKNVATQIRLASLYDECYLLHDGDTDIASDIRALNMTDLELDSLAIFDTSPTIPAEHLAAISFTSGSTGDSKPNKKYWHSLKVSSDINYRHMIPAHCGALYQVATVPAQHMWGLETSIFLPLHHNVCIADSRPFYPEDILSHLRLLPKPRMLVTTPVHLRSLVESFSEHVTPDVRPHVDLILCATSPLSSELAKSAETFFAGELREVYGCSEVGSMAVKRTANDSAWCLFEGIVFNYQPDGVVVTAEHLAESTLLQDKIERRDAHHFVLKGRSEDMIDIAGKRGSLVEINHVLLTFDGLQDGLVFFPKNQSGLGRLAAIVTLKPGVTKDDVKQHFRQHVDNAFVPRPIIVVDELPREETGKLSNSTIMNIYNHRHISV